MLDVMVAENQAERLVRLRKEAGLSQLKLSTLSGVNRALLVQAENDQRKLSYASAVKLAPYLNTSAIYLLEGVDDATEKARRTVADIEEMLKAAKSSELVELSLLGYVPAGYPLPNEQESLGKIRVPKDQLGSAREAKGLFALVVSGDSLAGDDIYPGFHIVINPNDKTITEGKIYLVRIENEVTVKHVVLKDGRPVLQASNAEYREIVPDNLEIIGRVVWAGTGKTL